jgi:hypothetical protein
MSLLSKFLVNAGVGVGETMNQIGRIGVLERSDARKAEYLAEKQLLTEARANTEYDRRTEVARGTKQIDRDETRAYNRGEWDRQNNARQNNASTTRNTMEEIRKIISEKGFGALNQGQRFLALGAYYTAAEESLKKDAEASFRDLTTDPITKEEIQARVDQRLQAFSPTAPASEVPVPKVPEKPPAASIRPGASSTGLINRLQGGEGQGRLLDLEAQERAESARQESAQPVVIATQEEYDKLPKGALYVGPDGKTRRKK